MRPAWSRSNARSARPSCGVTPNAGSRSKDPPAFMERTASQSDPGGANNSLVLTGFAVGDRFAGAQRGSSPVRSSSLNPWSRRRALRDSHTSQAVERRRHADRVRADDEFGHAPPFEAGDVDAAVAGANAVGSGVRFVPFDPDEGVPRTAAHTLNASANDGAFYEFNA